MIITDAQADLRRAYVGGGPGAIVSGLVWLVAGVATARYGTAAGFVHLFIGGMLIFPLSKLVCRFGFGRANEMSGNPGGTLVLESTAALIGGLCVAWLLLPLRPGMVLPVAALAVGTRYVLFQSAYGDRVYWLLGALISVVAVTGVLVPASQPWTVWAVAVIELAAGSLISLADLRRTGPSRSTLH
ncbi:hypothetical protein [Novosphingobium sp.]|uniref:DUF7010 family protein n=1 Tax=Novosphingobium sp. TaxID=1874826 RepID=UPI0026040248|nr:hypothetical protein [Novosphingobium sp.]